jgi:SAM-dependent methyltransferase
MTYSHPLSFLLGLEGVALLRAEAGDGFDRAFVERRLAGIRALLAAYDRGDLGEGTELGEIDTVSGYRCWAPTYDEPGNPLIEVEEPVVRGILAALPVGRALDAACGTGRHARFLAGCGHEVIGVDSSPDMLATARVRTPRGTFVVGDLHALPVPDAHVDLVVCALALTHLPALGPAMAEFARVLRPGGHLVLSDIHVQSLYLGGIAKATRPDGALARMPASRLLPSDYLSAALPLGFQVRRCVEPRWPPSPTAGGPDARRWSAAAADAVYETTPAAIIWHLQKPAD